MKTDKAKVQQVVDDVEEALEEVERTTSNAYHHADQASRAVKVLHKRLTAAGKLLSDEADGQIVTRATGEGK